MGLHIFTPLPQFCNNSKIPLVSLLWAKECELHWWAACFLVCMFSMFQRLPLHIINQPSRRDKDEKTPKLNKLLEISLLDSLKPALKWLSLSQYLTQTYVKNIIGLFKVSRDARMFYKLLFGLSGLKELQKLWFRCSSAALHMRSLYVFNLVLWPDPNHISPVLRPTGQTQ